MRTFLTLLLFAGLCTCVRAQVGGNVDAEYASWCMVDVISESEVVRFTRLVNIATLDVVDVDPVAGIPYTTTGTVNTCEAYDLQESTRNVQESTRNPALDLYEGCQCTYTISQEEHRVIEIRGGDIQDYTVEFQEVVRRKCTSQSASTVVHRDTLTKTGFFTANQRIEYEVSFVNNGDYIDDLNIRYYNPGSSIGSAITVDLNPATVVGSYPSLSLDAADFEYDGSNLADLATAYTQVIQFATGATQNLLQATTINPGILKISSQYLHEASGAYAILPWNTDGDYQLSGPAPVNGGASGLVKYAAGLATQTSDFNEYCEEINTSETGFYYFYSELSPRTIQINIGVETIYQPNFSNPIAACDAPPSTCAELATSSVALDGCVTICDTIDVRVVPSTDTIAVRVVPSTDTIDVRVVPSSDTIPVQVVAMPDDCTGADLPGHQRLTGTSTTYGADTFHSLSLTVVSGTVTVTINGATVEYPSGYSTRWAAPDPCDRLSQSFLIDAASGSVIIAYLQ